MYCDASYSGNGSELFFCEFSCEIGFDFLVLIKTIKPNLFMKQKNIFLNHNYKQYFTKEKISVNTESREEQGGINYEGDSFLLSLLLLYERI